MKKLILITMSIAALASSSAFAQEKTRAEVRQELIEAQHNGLDYVTDASYPDVSPVFASQVARMKAQYAAEDVPSQDAAKAVGGSSAGSSNSGSRIATTKPMSNEACVGPVSFCNIYAGS